MRSIVLIAHNLRSLHNVGSLMRTADGFGVSRVILSGYTPYPFDPLNDDRLPHVSAKMNRQIHKTALGAEQTQAWSHTDNIVDTIETLKSAGYAIVGLEQQPKSIDLASFQSPEKMALILGREVEGIEPEILELCDLIVEIAMYGQKESFNVVQAAAIALYQIKNYPASKYLA